MAVVFFDVFGTLVDWYGGVVREVSPRSWPIDPGTFAVEWRDAMFAGIREVVRGEQPWADLDEINRRSARVLLEAAGVAPREEDLEPLVGAWRRLDPWPDVPAGLASLRRHHRVATLSNGSVAMLTDLAVHGGLGFDAVVGCDIFKNYKPAPETYRGAMERLGVTGADASMVASHPYDLAAAASNGMHAAFVHRPGEWGGRRAPEDPPEVAELIVDSVVELADKMPRPC